MRIVGRLETAEGMTFWADRFDLPQFDKLRSDAGPDDAAVRRLAVNLARQVNREDLCARAMRTRRACRPGNSAGTGGRVTFDTVRQPLLCELHGPSRYVTPDVVPDMTGMLVEEVGADRVRVTGARGLPRPERLKVVGGYPDGWLGQIRIGYPWRDAAEKARAAAELSGRLPQKRGLVRTRCTASSSGLTR